MTLGIPVKSLKPAVLASLLVLGGATATKAITNTSQKPTTNPVTYQLTGDEYSKYVLPQVNGYATSTMKDTKEIYNSSVQDQDSTEVTQTDGMISPKMQYKFSVLKYLTCLNKEQRQEITESFQDNIFDVYNRAMEAFNDDCVKYGLLEKRMYKEDDAIFHNISTVAEEFIELFHKKTMLESKIDRFPWGGFDYPEGYDKEAKVNEIAVQVLGCPYKEYVEAHAADYDAIVKAFVGKSLLNQIREMENLPESARDFIKKSQMFEKVLDETDNQEKERLSQKLFEKFSTEIDMIETDTESLKNNENAENKDDFIPLQSQISQAVFSSLVDNGITNNIENTTVEKSDKAKSRKIRTANGIVIEKTNNDGTKSYYDVQGRLTSLN